MSGNNRKSSRKRRSLNFQDESDDIVVCTSGFDSETKRRIKVWVEDQKATFQTKFRSDTTTHLVSKNVLSEKYKAAVQGMFIIIISTPHLTIHDHLQLRFPCTNGARTNGNDPR